MPRAWFGGLLSALQVMLNLFQHLFKLPLTPTLSLGFASRGCFCATFRSLGFAVRKQVLISLSLSFVMFPHLSGLRYASPCANPLSWILAVRTPCTPFQKLHSQFFSLRRSPHTDGVSLAIARFSLAKIRYRCHSLCFRTFRDSATLRPTQIRF